MSEQPSRPPEVAFYYPGHLWASAAWVKTMLPYFDGIAMLVPTHKQDELEKQFPELAIPLADQGLLHTIVPEQAVDAAATGRLADALLPIIDSGLLDSLDRSASAFSTLSKSRLGFAGDQEIARKLHEALKARGLARDGGAFSFPIQEQVRALVLTLVAQVLRSQTSARGFQLQPATDQPNVIAGLSDLLALEHMPSAAHVVRTEFEEVGVDLCDVTLDEVLDFRRQHGAEYRRYARDLRKFLRELSLLDDAQRREAITDRQEALADRAADLRQRSTRAWKRPASVLLNVSGAVWATCSGDPLGGLLGVASQAAGSGSPEPGLVGAYSYLFRAARQFG